MRLKVSKRVFYGSGLYIVLMLLMFHDVSSIYVRNICSIITILLCVVNMIKARGNCISLLLHFQLLYYNYSVIFSRYLNTVQEYQGFYENASDYVLGIGIVCLFTFEFFSWIFNVGQVPFSSDRLYTNNPNSLISFGLLVLAIIVAMSSFNWSSYGSRGAISSTYEYIGILLILGLYYAGKNRNKFIKYGYSLFIVGLVFQGIIFGERVSALQFIIIWCIYFMYNHLNVRNIFVGGVIGIVLMSAVGAFRNSYTMNGISLSTVWNELMNRKLTFNGADLGYYCSLTFVMVSKEVPIVKRLDLFMQFIQSIFVGNSEGAYLPEFTRQYYAHWYGGFYPLYFYFYGGMPLVVISTYIWNRFVKKCLIYNKKKYNDIFSLLSIYIVAIAARWYMYTPLSAFRPIILFSIAFFSLKMVARMFGRK